MMKRKIAPEEHLILPADYSEGHDDDTASVAIINNLETNKNLQGKPCKLIAMLLHNLFQPSQIKEAGVETQSAAIKYIADAIKNANYTEDSDTYSSDFWTDEYETAKKDATGKFSAFLKFHSRDTRERETQMSLIKTKNPLFFTKRAEAIIKTLYNKVHNKLDSELQTRIGRCGNRDNYQVRLNSNCKLGFYENKDGCCKQFSPKIIFGTNDISSDAHTKDIKTFEKQFLHLKYEDYTVKEAILITNIFVFLQYKIWGDIRPLVNNLLALRINPKRTLYGDFDCETSKDMLKRVKAGSVTKTVLSGAKGAGALAIGSGLFTLRAVATLATKGLFLAAKKFQPTQISEMKIETEGDQAAAKIVSNTKSMFKIATSIYEEFVKLILKQIIKLQTLKGYRYNTGTEIQAFLLEAYADTTSVAEFINLKSTNRSFEDFEDELVLSFTTLSETVTTAVSPLPGIGALLNFVIKKITTFIQQTCVEASLELQYDNDLTSWLRDSNIEKHLMAIPQLKHLYPDVFRKLHNITDDAVWRSMSIKQLSIEHEETPADEAAASYSESPEIVSHPTLDEFIRVKNGGTHKRHRTKRSQSSSKLKQNSKRARSKLAKRRSRSRAGKKMYAYQK